MFKTTVPKKTAIGGKEATSFLKKNTSNFRSLPIFMLESQRLCARAALQRVTDYIEGALIFEISKFSIFNKMESLHLRILSLATFLVLKIEELTELYISPP